MTGVPTPEDDKYLSGKENTLIRYYFYLLKGLDVVNNFRNLVLGILALYVLLHLTNIFFAVVMFVVSSAVIAVFGWYSVHRIAKQHEWIGMRFSTHYGIKNFDYVKDSNELLRDIKELLEKNQNVRQNHSN